MNARERKAAMILADVTAASIAERLDVNPSHVSMVISGVRRSSRVELAVAEAIHRPVSEVFPPVQPAGAAA